MAVYDCTNDEGLEAGVEAATDAVREGRVVVLPTDTVYGVGCDAFSGAAVASVLDAKGRGRDMPPPVLVPSPRTVDGLALGVPGWARDLMEEFWPGPLTLVFRSHTSLVWDLGDTNGTVALRMPDDPVALRLLTEVGPMAVTSANRTGNPAATTVMEAATQLGSSVDVYLDGGTRAESLASTILDCTGDEPTVLRQGELSWADIAAVLARSADPATDEPADDTADDTSDDTPDDTADDTPDDTPDEDPAEAADAPTVVPQDADPDDPDDPENPDATQEQTTR